MTQRVELATVRDRLSVDALITDYAAALDDGDWAAFRALFAPDGRADYRSAGGVEGDVEQVAAWLADSMRPVVMRQHLIVNRRLRFGVLDQAAGDTAEMRADYVSPMRLSGSEGALTAPDFVCGGRYAFGALRTDDGWRLHRVAVQEKWRRADR
ncbi:nuclear transport factor 2 family protein [Streptomyces sp. NPDC028635]|uniref:nuclear transport factor 2 family protein n=1 Tax=Streptomyces sp. NPDC028635 TaxID=3154800 RepID=UPI0033F54557